MLRTAHCVANYGHTAQRHGSAHHITGTSNQQVHSASACSLTPGMPHPRPDSRRKHPSSPPHSKIHVPSVQHNAPVPAMLLMAVTLDSVMVMSARPPSLSISRTTPPPTPSAFSHQTHHTQAQGPQCQPRYRRQIILLLSSHIAHTPKPAT